VAADKEEYNQARTTAVKEWRHRPVIAQRGRGWGSTTGGARAGAWEAGLGREGNSRNERSRVRSIRAEVQKKVAPAAWKWWGFLKNWGRPGRGNATRFDANLVRLPLFDTRRSVWGKEKFTSLDGGLLARLQLLARS